MSSNIGSGNTSGNTIDNSIRISESSDNK
jgi:hypothetical protein